MKKVLLLFFVLAVMVSVLMLSTPEDNANRADVLGKQFAAENSGAVIHTSTSEMAITEKEEVDRAELIVTGTVLAADPYWDIYEDDEFPTIMTKYAVQVDQVIKGDPPAMTISVVVFGGNLDGITHITPSTELTKNDKVLLLLGKDTSSVFGNDYALVSASKSIYVIIDDQATNDYSERSGPLDVLIKRITSKLSD